VQMKEQHHDFACIVLSVLFFAAALAFVYRSFYGMRITSDESIPTTVRRNETPRTETPLAHGIGAGPG
jgi:hypothetical protein